MTKLTFYPFEFNTPEKNMEIDNYFLRKGEGFVFRLYGWKPHGVSIGVSQKKENVCNTEYCKEKGIEIVKRVTGGGAVYHKNDITYMLSCPLDFFEEKTVLGVYRKIAQMLMAIFKSLKIECYFAGRVQRELRVEGMKKGIACFLLPSDYEIVVRGKKIVGNALRIEKNRILQHGSIAYDFDYKETAAVLNTSDEKLRQRVISLKEIKPDLTIKQFEEACITCLKGYGFDINVERKGLPLIE